MRLFVIGVTGQRSGAVHHAMSLDISLSNQIDTVFIAQVIPARVIRIVTGTYSVDIHLLHYPYILYHTLQRNYVSTFRIHLMTVCTLYEYGLSVHQQLTVAYLNLTESHLLGNYFKNGTCSIGKSQIESI